MPRTMVEVLIKTATRNLSIFNTHLAFHSEEERIAQTNAITTIRNQISENSKTAANEDLSGPYRFSNASDAIILCGDLNIDSESDIYTQQLVDRKWVDCWTKAPQQQQSIRHPTCGCHDHIQWPQGPHVRDYFFATSNIADKTLNVEVDVDTDASDHQPVLLEMAL